MNIQLKVANFCTNKYLCFLKNYKIYIAPTILLGCLSIMINIVCTSYVKNETEYYNLLKITEFQKIVKSIIIDNITLLKQIKFKDIHDKNIKISMIRSYIKDQIFVSKPSDNSMLSNVSSGYVNLQELLNDTASSTFNYMITINNHKIVSNGNISLGDSLNTLTSEQYKIDKDLMCNVIVAVNPNSIYAKQLQKRSSEQIISILTVSNLILFSLFFVIYYYVNKQKKLKEELEEVKIRLDESYKRNKQIVHYTEKNKEFILSCYKYSKNLVFKSRVGVLLEESIIIDNKNEEYLPLPIMSKEKKSIINAILMQSIINDIKDYFYGYEALYNTKINLKVTTSIETITVPFEYEEFNQIIISLFLNILHFNKGADKSKYIKLFFKKNTIICSSNGFLLNKELAIKYSEKIFNDIGNPYLMNLRQIFILFKTYNIDCEVTTNNNQETTFEVKLPNKQNLVNENSKTDNKVIKLNNYKKEKLYK
jgi:hypothetical protein